ncbi:hypothetical protein QWI17_11325 [Gilvimarinus sp. SDUM040013]|uniref:Uncharacterized protein n=1 Tax=Gilvimarinus gilvus TaxID=3058038 RepID=A0ABU4RZJ7_9GAMM|nr:hypothetical protein [Gilvimarinus sp. SDUM040013]MDO3386430.1 hypothetical protein [Gilvimarinus sp. SDUM040013]MDX6849696.1 hypothetical protein [Gilvimarinus sp. SDUM040013]
MAATFFGQYLQIKGIIDREQLLQALALQSSSNRSFGQLAVDEGLLSAAQSAQINLRQRETDALFGELAESLGWLTGAQVSQLLARQQLDHVTLGQALINLGVLTDAQLQHLLADYHYWNLRNQRECNRRVSQSPLAPHVDGFTYLLERQLQREYGLFSQPSYVLTKHPLTFPEWTWRMVSDTVSSVVGVAPAPSFVQTLKQRQQVMQDFELAGHLQGQPVYAAGVSPEDFFGRLLRQLAEEINHSWLEEIDDAGSRPSVSGDSLCIGYSIEGEPLQVYFCAA